MEKTNQNTPTRDILSENGFVKRVTKDFSTRDKYPYVAIWTRDNVVVRYTTIRHTGFWQVTIADNGQPTLNKEMLPEEEMFAILVEHGIIKKQ